MFGVPKQLSRGNAVVRTNKIEREASMGDEEAKNHI